MSVSVSQIAMAVTGLLLIFVVYVAAGVVGSKRTWAFTLGAAVLAAVLLSALRNFGP